MTMVPKITTHRVFIATLLILTQGQRTVARQEVWQSRFGVPPPPLWGELLSLCGHGRAQAPVDESLDCGSVGSETAVLPGDDDSWVATHAVTQGLPKSLHRRRVDHFDDYLAAVVFGQRTHPLRERLIVA